ncbi:MAG: transposase [Lentisphaeria bacterium]
MSQSLAKVWIHLIFSTHNRRRAFVSEASRTAVCGYMTGIFKNLDCPVARINLAVDHVHILHLMSRTHALSEVVATVKRQTTDWIKEQEWARGNPDFHQFHWQGGFGAFSVSESVVPNVKAYIDGQLEHHQRVTFQDEFREFMQRHGVELDERYAWD